jgi:hypothetical protein
MLRRMDERELAMSIESEKDPTKYFSVVGAAYVPERHDDVRTADRTIASEPASGVAGLWLVFYVVVIGLSVIANSSVAKWVNVANLLP